MTSRIELDLPYSRDWDCGYLQVNREGRCHVYLYKRRYGDSRERRSTVQYARYLVSVKYGRYLTKEETVDHIDGVKTNNSLENLQVLTSSEDTKKYTYNLRTSLVEIICPVCDTLFSRRRGLTQLVPSKVDTVCCCSKQCANKLKKIHLTSLERVSLSKGQIVRTYISESRTRKESIGLP